jgi:hypothetical protein
LLPPATEASVAKLYKPFCTCSPIGEGRATSGWSGQHAGYYSRSFASLAGSGCAGAQLVSATVCLPAGGMIALL